MLDFERVTSRHNLILVQLCLILQLFDEPISFILTGFHLLELKQFIIYFFYFILIILRLDGQNFQTASLGLLSFQLRQNQSFKVLSYSVVEYELIHRLFGSITCSHFDQVTHSHSFFISLRFRNLWVIQQFQQFILQVFTGLIRCRQFTQTFTSFF